MATHVRGVVLAVMVGIAATACGPTDWPMLGFGPGHAGLSPDTTVNTSNVSTLTVKWTAQPPTPWAPKQYPNLFSSAAVAGGTLFVGSYDGNLYAYDGAGNTNCSGTRKLCAPMWRATSGPSDGLKTPVVVNGVVYVAGGNGLAAFDAAGSTNCGGTPKTCAPLWTSGPLGLYVYSSPVVAGGVVYVTSDNNSGSPGTVYAFDAAGNTGCAGSPKTCAALWTASLGGHPYGSTAVGNGTVYVTADDNQLYAFNAAGNTGCSGTPKTCTALWTAPTGDAADGTPAVVDGVVYVSSGANSPSGTLYAFDASGASNCSGSPKTCNPLWSAAVDGGGRSPAVANGVVYLSTDAPKLYAFDATGTTNCTGTPKTCSPLWTGGPVWGLNGAVVANGLVYTGTATGLSVFDATGNMNCSGTPKTCSPLRTVNTDMSNTPTTGLALANGMVYFSVGYLGAYDYQMYAVGLP